MRRGPRLISKQRGPRAHAAGASMKPKRRRPARQGGGGVDETKAKEAFLPLRRGPR